MKELTKEQQKELKKLADEMTRVLKNISVPGIRVVAETGEALDSITAYDLRRLYLTGGDGEGFSEDQLDKSVGRATGKSETSKTYILRSPLAPVSATAAVEVALPRCNSSGAHSAKA